MTRSVVIMENDCRHKATAVAQRLASHPRFAVLWLPTAVFMGAHLESQYTIHASAPLPSQLFLKTPRPDFIVAFPLRGQKEVVFYTRIAATTPASLVVRCYDAVYAPEAKKVHLVLEDVSTSPFQATVWPLSPVESRCVQAINCLAQLHAHWWDHTSLAQHMGARPTEIFIRDLFIWTEAEHQSFRSTTKSERFTKIHKHFEGSIYY